MTSLRWLAAAATLAVVLVPARAARAEPGTVAAHDVYILDEYNLDVLGAPDSSRIAVGLSFGSAYPNGWWWTAGPRVSFVRWSADVPQQTGFGAGGAFRVRLRPRRSVSPDRGIAIDRDLSVRGAVCL